MLSSFHIIPLKRWSCFSTHPSFQWIGLSENLHRKPWFLQWNIGLFHVFPGNFPLDQSIDSRVFLGPWSPAGPHQLQPGHGQLGSQQLAPSAAASGQDAGRPHRHRLQLCGKPRFPCDFWDADKCWQQLQGWRKLRQIKTSVSQKGVLPVIGHEGL